MDSVPFLRSAWGVPTPTGTDRGDRTKTSLKVNEINKNNLIMVFYDHMNLSKNNYTFILDGKYLKNCYKFLLYLESFSFFRDLHTFSFDLYSEQRKNHY